MGYCVEASLIWGIPADEVPQEWLAENGCEDVGEVWMEYGDVYSQHGGDRFTCHTQGSDCESSHYVGYVVGCAELDSADELGQISEILKGIHMLDMKPFDEMCAYKKVKPRLFLVCSYL